MQKNKIFQISILFIVSLLMVGCSATKVEPQTREVKVSSSSLLVKGKKSYKKNEAVKFEIDTGKDKGYLYVVYLDKKGEKEVMTPSKNKVRGNFSFPKDFGVDVSATKECKGCKVEKTTVYVLLSKDPILEIKSMNKDDLVDLGKKSKEAKSRGLFLEDGNVLVQKIEFLVN